MKGRKPGDGDLAKIIPMPGMTGGPVAQETPPAPEDLGAIAREVWEFLAPHLAAKGRLSPIYRYQFRAYCEAVQEWRLALDSFSAEAREGLIEADDGERLDPDAPPRHYVTEGRNGSQHKAHPALQTARSFMAVANQLATVFGLNPLDDARLKDPNQGGLFDQLRDMINGDG